jgi:hypothetical protein
MEPHRKNETIEGNRPEPRWPAMLSLLAVGGVYAALPASLSLGPQWLLVVIVGALLVPAILAHHRGRPELNMVLGCLLAGVVTLFMAGSLVLLVLALPAHKESPVELLRSAALLWVTNVLVFASWYWRLDAGGPHMRARRSGHPTGAFLFPQMSADERHRRESDGRPWSPRFVDYLFLAFNTSTALSPTDAPVLSRWAKALMMVQSLISLSVIVILVGRAMNIM